jgi:alanine dehydrogenase
MRVGVPKEIKTREYRVGLTPGGVREFVAHGHTVLVEAGLGAGIAASDRDYQDAGAAVLDNAGAVFAQAELIVKVKEPQPAEWSRLREGQILFTYLHLAADPEQARGLMDSGCTAVAYETVTDDYGGLPLLAPMSEVAGRLAIEAAGTTLQRHVGGRGILIGGVAGVAPARVLILGGGVVGAQAARMAVGLGADVTILDRSVPRLRLLDEMLQGRAKTLYATASSIEEQALVADVVIGAVLVAGARAPKLIARSLLARMRRGAVLVDVAIDQGGCFETSRPTTYDAPIYEVDGVMHYCVSNMPGAVPVTSSHALGNATLPFGLAIAKNGLNAIAADQHLQAGLNVYRGAITNAAVATSLSLPFVPFSEAVRRSATT